MGNAMNSRGPLDRFGEVHRTRLQLERHEWPRVQMSLIVLATGAIGLLASFLLLRAGLDSMALRFPLAILIAYGAFLLLMWAWMRWRGDAVPDVLDASVDVPLPRSGGGWSGGGGGSGGGGASASWSPSTGSASGSGDAGVLDAVDVVDADGWPLLAIVATAAIALVCVVATGWIVWSAPALMAELVVDAAIAGGLYRRMRGAEAQGWWWLCVRHTFWPLAGVLLFFVALGGLADHLAPQADTLVQVLRAL
ncbi:MAG TPA: hypothetical protein VGD42_03725 [Lysobacter sp.]